VTYVNCGHNPPVLLRADGTRTLLDHGVSALGLFRGAPPDTATVTLAPDDVLVLYTDGVVEIWDSDDNDFGLARLEEVVRQCTGLDARSVIDRIVSTTQAFTGRAHYDDDFTVMVVRRQAGASSATGTTMAERRLPRR
jgi:sigma-B regulation protein RsbU (phosphoserine phosphatase)